MLGSTQQVFIKQSQGGEALACGLRHPHLAAVLAVAPPQVVQERVAGPDLRSVLAAGRPPLHLAVRWMRQLLAVLAYLHGRGIVHRDVKPANLLLTEDAQLKLADFGIACRIGDVVRSNIHSGTPQYMAPEQMRGAPAAPACDLYSAAVVFYELLTGSLPRRGSAFEIVQQALDGEVPPPSHFQSDVTPALERLLLRALARNVDQRHGSAQEFLTALEAAACPVVWQKSSSKK